MPSQPVSKSARAQGDLSVGGVLSSSILSAVIVLNHRQQIVTLTDNATRMLGLKSDLKLPASSEILPEPLPRVVRDACASGRPVAGIPLRDPKMGDALPVSASVFPGDAGKDNGQVVVVLTGLRLGGDLERRLQLLERLASAGTLSASLAHEIRNALVAVKTFVDLLLEKGAEPELAGIVRRELARIDSLVGSMLRLGGPAKPAFTAIRLHEVLESALRLVQPQLDGKSIVPARSFQAASDVVQGDARELEQAFLNLLLNAFEATGPGGTLTVATEVVAELEGALGGSTRQAQVRVTIKDTGPGIAAEVLEHVFEPFITTKQDGTGLGLAITKGIIEEHKGEITVTSQPGQGTTFQVSLPVSLN